MIRIEWITCMLALILILPTAFAQQIIDQPLSQPTCDQIAISSLVTQESQNTRKFMLDTYDQKSTAFFQAADNRISYMENKLKSTLDSAIVSLSIVFAGVTLFILSLYAFFSRLMERARYKKMEKSITENIMREINKKVDTRQDGYMTLRNYGQEDKQAEMQKIAEFQRQQMVKQQEQEYAKEIAMIQAKISMLKQGQYPMPPQSPAMPQSMRM